MNIKAQPKTKAVKLIDKLNKMVIRREVNELELKRCKVEAEKLKKIDIARAFTILGMVACLEKDIEKMHSFHKNAIIYSPEDVVTIYQYVVSLANLDLFQDGYTWALKAYKKDPLYSDIIDILIKITNKLDLEDKFRIYTNKWLKLTKKPHFLVSFPEDNDGRLSKMFNGFDELMDSQSDLILTPDPELIKLADELVEGVDTEN